MVRSSKEDVLNKDERELLLSHTKKEKEELVIKGLMYTGMRAGEFANLTNAWLDWQKEVIRVPEHDGNWKPKTKAGAREIPLMFEAKRVLYNHFRNRGEINLTRISLYRIVRRVSQRITPFKKVYPHSLRATFASMLAEADMNASDIQMILGWSKLETANAYVRSTQSIQNFRDKMKNME